MMDHENTVKVLLRLLDNVRCHVLEYAARPENKASSFALVQSKAESHSNSKDDAQQ